MKYLLVLIVVVVGLWLLMRPGRNPGTGKPARGSPKAPDRMIQCRHCGIHLPEREAVGDERGDLYCSDAHRLSGPR